MGQVTIIGSVILVLLLIGLVIGAYAWGVPLMRKAGDKAKVDYARRVLEQIRDAIEYVATTGGSKEIKVELEDAALEVSEGENWIGFEITTRIPIIGSKEWIPLDYTSLPFGREVMSVDLSPGATACAGISYYGNVTGGDVTIDGNYYIITAYNTSVEYDLICINCTCGKEGQEIGVEGLNYSLKVANIAGDGSGAFLLGKEVERIGTYGREPWGIIIAKALLVGETQRIGMRLRYRGLKDEVGTIYRIRLNCGHACRVIGGRRRVLISREALPRRGADWVEFDVTLILE